MKKVLLPVCSFSFLFFSLTINCFSQSIVVSGKITGDKNEALSEASVIVKGSNKGTITKSDGTFSVTALPNAILVISHTGYITKEIPVKENTVIEESLQLQNQQMNEVVVIGYQTASRKSVTTAISSIGSKEIKSYVTGNVANSIQGKLAGVQVFSGNGLPGSQPTLVIRGLSSLTGNTTPLIIVDGNEIGYNALNFLNPADI